MKEKYDNRFSDIMSMTKIVVYADREDGTQTSWNQSSTRLLDELLEDGDGEGGDSDDEEEEHDDDDEEEEDIIVEWKPFG